MNRDFLSEVKTMRPLVRKGNQKKWELEENTP